MQPCSGVILVSTQERLEMTVTLAEVIWNNGIKSRLIAEGQLFISDNNFL
jgi:hypothetical protein